jgi:hypothetical protein
MAEIGSAGSPLELKLGQAARAKDPQVNYEMQLIYNSVHLLGQYLEVLRQDLEGTDSDIPSESLKFLRKISVEAGQDIVAGNVCCVIGNLAYKGVGTTPPVGAVNDGAVTIGSTGTRSLFGVNDTQFYIAVEDASAGSFVSLGVPQGAVQIAGAKCGQIVWAAGAQSIWTKRQANTAVQILFSRPFTGEGSLFLSNPIQTFTFAAGGGYRWEGYWMPGFPYQSGSEYNYNRNFLYPIGICIVDNFALISSRVYSPSPVHVIPAP